MFISPSVSYRFGDKLPQCPTYTTADCADAVIAEGCCQLCGPPPPTTTSTTTSTTQSTTQPTVSYLIWKFRRAATPENIWCIRKHVWQVEIYIQQWGKLIMKWYYFELCDYKDITLVVVTYIYKKIDPDQYVNHGNVKMDTRTPVSYVKLGRSLFSSCFCHDLYLSFVFINFHDSNFFFPRPPLRPQTQVAWLMWVQYVICSPVMEDVTILRQSRSNAVSPVRVNSTLTLLLTAGTLQ